MLIFFKININTWRRLFSSNNFLSGMKYIEFVFFFRMNEINFEIRFVFISIFEKSYFDENFEMKLFANWISFKYNSNSLSLKNSYLIFEKEEMKK